MPVDGGVDRRLWRRKAFAFYERFNSASNLNEDCDVLFGILLYGVKRFVSDDGRETVGRFHFLEQVRVTGQYVLQSVADCLQDGFVMLGADVIGVGFVGG